jgi:signal transduction histidine kinase
MLSPIAINIFMIVVGVVNFILGLVVYLKDTENKGNRYFGFTAISIAMWAWTRAFFQLSSGDNAFFWGKLLFIIPTLIPISLLLFAIFFGEEKRRLSKRNWFIIITSFLAIIALGLWPGLIFKELIIDVDGKNDALYGPGFRYYAISMGLYLVAGFTVLVRKHFKAKGILRIQLRYILLGSFVSIFIAIMANLVLPNLGNTQFVWAGPLATLFMIGSISYAMSAHRLWDFKLITTEVFAFFILFILLAEIFVAESVGTQIFKGVTFLLVAIFSYFLIRSIIKEIESRERILRLAENLSAANKRLLELDVEKSDFVSIASHQLRTPLTIIKGYSSMLLEGSFGVIEKLSQREAIDKIYQASQRLVLMIEDFLNISRIEKGEMIYNMARVDFRELVKEVISDLSAALKGEKLDVAFESQKDHDFYITGDHLKLRQVVSNIIDNSIKYTPNGGKIEVKLTRDEKEGSIIFSVTDSGVGLTKEAIEKLFQKFSRAKGMSKLHTEGRGLGLYVAKQIVEAHGGNIKAYSSGKDQGSTFTAILPDLGKGKNKEIRSFIEEM